MIIDSIKNQISVSCFFIRLKITILGRFSQTKEVWGTEFSAIIVKFLFEECTLISLKEAKDPARVRQQFVFRETTVILEKQVNKRKRRDD